MNPFRVLHHYPCQNKNINMSMSLNSYITHLTGAGPRGLLSNTDDPWDRALNQLAHEIFANNIAYRSYYQTRKGHCDCFTITILKKGVYSLSPPPMAGGILHHLLQPLPPSLTSSPPPPPDWKKTHNENMPLL